MSLTEPSDSEAAIIHLVTGQGKRKRRLPSDASAVEVGVVGDPRHHA